MRLSLAPIKYKDHRTYDFHKTFGTATSTRDEFNFDTIGVFEDQNADGLPQGCTAYAVNDVASNEDGTYYDDQVFTYNNTKAMLGLAGDVPVDLMTALSSATDYGVKKKTETDKDAANHRRAPYFIVRPLDDYYDGLLSALQIKKGGIALGTSWPAILTIIGQDGIAPSFDAPKTFARGHAWVVYGQKMVNNEPRLICKPWLGPNFGHGGYCYFNREQINSLLSAKGAGAFGQMHAEPGDIQRVKMSIIETIISYMWKLIPFITFAKITTMPTPTPTPTPVPVSTTTPNNPSRVTEFCSAIKEYEGYILPGGTDGLGIVHPHGSPAYRNNNPGNCKYSPVGYAPLYGHVGRSPEGFAIFKDYETGWLYLNNLIKGKAHDHPTLSILAFMSEVYAPVPENDPVKYAHYIGVEMKVDEKTFTMGELLS